MSKQLLALCITFQMVLSQHHQTMSILLDLLLWPIAASLFMAVMTS